MTQILDEKTQHKWNNIYDDKALRSLKPSRVVLENIHLVAPNGRALELACGLAADAFYLAEYGLQVEAWDISDVVVDKINVLASREKRSVTASVKDLSNISVDENCFDLISVAHYLDRNLVSAIIKMLKPGGLLFYQTFTRTVTDAYSGPGNPDFRLLPGELLDLFSDLSLVVYREEALLGDLTKGLRNEVLFVAQKPD